MTLAGTGRVVILPVDQGFEHGPARGFAANPPAHVVFEQVRAIRDGGAFGSIIGRNSFQRPRPEALAFLRTIMGLYAGTVK